MKKLLFTILITTAMSFANCEYYSSFYSSFIDNAIYCPTSDYYGTVTLTLNGTDYDYDISYDTWIGFKNASSKGSYYNQYIKR